MSKAIAHGAQLADRPVQFLRLSRQHLSVDTWLPVWREHPCDLIKGKPGCAAKRNQHQPFEYTVNWPERLTALADLLCGWAGDTLRSPPLFDVVLPCPNLDV